MNDCRWCDEPGSGKCADCSGTGEDVCGHGTDGCDHCGGTGDCRGCDGTGTEMFSEYDHRMISVMSELENLRDRLFKQAVWFSNAWTAMTGEVDVPFFELLERIDDDGSSCWKVVFVLREDECPMALMEQFKD